MSCTPGEKLKENSLPSSRVPPSFEGLWSACLEAAKAPALEAYRRFGEQVRAYHVTPISATIRGSLGRKISRDFGHDIDVEVLYVPSPLHDLLKFQVERPLTVNQMIPVNGATVEIMVPADVSKFVQAALDGNIHRVEALFAPAECRLEWNEELDAILSPLHADPARFVRPDKALMSTFGIISYFLEENAELPAPDSPDYPAAYRKWAKQSANFLFLSEFALNLVRGGAGYWEIEREPYRLLREAPLGALSLAELKARLAERARELKVETDRLRKSPPSLDQAGRERILWQTARFIHDQQAALLERV